MTKILAHALSPSYPRYPRMLSEISVQTSRITEGLLLYFCYAVGLSSADSPRHPQRCPAGWFLWAWRGIFQYQFSFVPALACHLSLDSAKVHIYLNIATLFNSFLLERWSVESSRYRPPITPDHSGCLHPLFHAKSRAKIRICEQTTKYFEEFLPK